MKANDGKKHLSRWSSIRVVSPGQVPHVYTLDVSGRVVAQSIPRNPRRRLTEPNNSRTTPPIRADKAQVVADPSIDLFQELEPLQMLVQLPDFPDDFNTDISMFNCTNEYLDSMMSPLFPEYRKQSQTSQCFDPDR
jgi:hypothetical protein